MHTGNLAGNITPKAKRPWVVPAVLLTLVVALALILTDVAWQGHRSTRWVAERYLSSIVAGDRERASSLLRGEVLCSGPGMWQTVNEHVTLFGSAEVRNVTIAVSDLTGSVAYSPGTEGADIRFEYRRPGHPEWRAAHIGVAAVKYRQRQTLFRAICWLWTADW